MCKAPYLYPHQHRHPPQYFYPLRPCTNGRGSSGPVGSHSLTMCLIHLLEDNVRIFAIELAAKLLKILKTVKG